ncbi:pleckstrin homology domain-containing family A member 4 isoform X2 [Antennarius striatus]|uniref:pleckstrin homology domain-containing family A member 4 isoform X2 n=1 Tax=Antennarius striatus TaxID=241820 RepID=UPI0035B16273
MSQRMEMEASSKRAQLVRMDDQDRVSQASSVATISYFPVKDRDGKVQTFGKRCQAAKRDPNCPVVIRGWLNKKDSSGLKLWKRRWFVLSNYCLFYYKDSREESVLGSIPLPSYKILFCTPRECKNRKFTFKVVHQGMRSYFFSADTQEDMLGWVRALSLSATMEPEGSLTRRCSSYQDFTQMGGSSESVDVPKPYFDGEGPSHRHRNISRTLSEPSHLTGGRVGTSHSDHRGRRAARQRSSRTPSPLDDSRGRVCGPNREHESLPGQNNPLIQAEMLVTGSLISRGQLGSRPHTPVGRVDIRPHDDSVIVPQALFYAPASPKPEFKSTPNTPVTERWQKVLPSYGPVHHVSSGRRLLGKSYSTGAHTDLLPPLPPSSRATHAPHPPHHHHHHRSNSSVCALPPVMVPKPNLREVPPIRPLESDADAVLTRLCGCDKLLQSLSFELAQLQIDKESVHCALEVSRLQLEDWKNQGPRAQEEALVQKALLQEELVTIRARMCDVSLEMERVWSQYERMESELTVLHSQLQHICNFGLPQEQSQAQRELWMMEDILAGLKINRDHFNFLLGLQRHHTFQSTTPHSGSPGSSLDRMQSGFPMDVEHEPPARPPLPQELQETHQRKNPDHGWTDLSYEGDYNHTTDLAQRRGNIQPDLLNLKPQKDASESQSGSKRIPVHTKRQLTKKVKMSEEEQIERMKRNQERLTNNKKSPISAPDAQTKSQGSSEEAPFPLRVTRVITAVLPTSLVARRVSVEDPPPELDNPLPEQIPPETQQIPATQSKKISNKPPRHLLLESHDPHRSSAEAQQDQPAMKTNRQRQHQGILRPSKNETQSETSRDNPIETSRGQVQDQAGLGSGNTEERLSALLTPDLDPELHLSPEQREAKLRRLERIRERVMKSAVRESATAHNLLPISGEKEEAHRLPPARKQRIRSDPEDHHACESHEDNLRGSAELQLPRGTSQKSEDELVKKSKTQVRFWNKTQLKDQSGRMGVVKNKVKRPPSPYHVSSMTVYQKDGSSGFTNCKDGGQQKLEESSIDDNESDVSSCDARAKWFLSTNQWQGFVPLQIPGIESLCCEEMSDVENQRACADDDSNELSTTVSESLEKMKENHSLFYKIACDISISDTDITKNEGNSNAQTLPRPEEEELVITESELEETTPGTCGSTNPGKEDYNLRLLPSDVTENSLLTNHKIQDSTPGIEDKATLNPPSSPSKDSRLKEFKDTATQQGLSEEGNETIHGALIQDPDCDQTLDKKKREEDSRAKESDGVRDDQERSEEAEKCSLSEENKETAQEQEKDNNHSITPCSPVHEAGKVIQSGSFGKARVTVIRTSL